MAGAIGIMQGRLSPPVGEAVQAFPASQWKKEFVLAREAGLNHIEWIFGDENLTNPILSPAGVEEMLAVSARSDVRINSLCADYFMSEWLLRGSPAEQALRREKLVHVIGQCAMAGIRHLVLPFVDQSSIQGDVEQERLISLMHSLLPLLADHYVELHLETSLSPRAFATLLERIGSPFVKINYDTGNSASLGYDPVEEFAAYGRWIGSIHLKDRLRGGATIPLGEGSVNFRQVNRLLKEIGFQGDFTLQVARNRSGNETAWARHNRQFWQKLQEAMF